MKILSVGAQLFYADGRTDGGTTMTKLVTFRNFANGRKKLKVLFFPLILNFPKEHFCFGNSQASSLCPSDKGSMHLKMN
jgi:hypothetical protein